MVATVARTIEMLALPIKPPHWSICSRFLDLELSKKQKGCSVNFYGLFWWPKHEFHTQLISPLKPKFVI
jgi:hypothetical protein